MKIRAIDKDVKDILTSNYYKIPRFQRPYSWDTENIIEFWNDTIAEKNGEEEYFIGAIVIYDDKYGFKGIVDGQQRLTTIIIMLCALRDVFLSEGYEDLGKGVQTIIERADINNVKQFVISTESSFPYLQEKILTSEKSNITVNVGPEEKNIESAFNYFLSNISQTIQSVKDNPTISENHLSKKIESELVNIRESILNLKLIFVELDNEDDAYLIFETLNTRGKDLKTSDLLRNFFTKNIHPTNRESDAVKLKWKNILSNINDSSAELDLDKYLHHHWLSKHSYVSAKKLYKEIKSKIKGNSINEYLDELESNSQIYRNLHEVSSYKWEKSEIELKNSLVAFDIFNVKQHIPIILSAFRNYKNGKIKIKHLRNLMSTIENFHFIYTAITASRSTGGMAQMYSSYAINLEKEKNAANVVDIIQEFIEKLESKIPSIEEFKINFNELIYTDKFTKHKNLVKYILQKYDCFLRKGDIIDYTKMTIEHLIPQNSKSHKIDEKIIGSIGNLFLVDEKTNCDKLRNKLFAEKKKILNESNYPLDIILNKHDELTKDVIIQRTDHIAKVGYSKIWKI